MAGAHTKPVSWEMYPTAAAAPVNNIIVQVTIAILEKIKIHSCYQALHNHQRMLYHKWAHPLSKTADNQVYHLANSKAYTGYKRLPVLVCKAEANCTVPSRRHAL